jgi:hypothetical protein
MTGIGEVYERFASGELTDDDEVALTFDASTGNPLSYPLIQIRNAVSVASDRHPEAAGDLKTFLCLVQALPFDERSGSMLRRLLDGLPVSPLSDPLI